MNAATPVTSLLYRLFPGRIKKPDRAGNTSGEPVQELSDHIVIVGYGMTGKSVARAAEILGIPYTAIDMDPDVVRRERYADSHREIIFGDATHREILEHAGIGRARALVVVISEQNVVPGIIHLAREMAPKIYIVVRTRHVNDARHLLDLGADEVIPEEFETSVRIFTRVLAKYTLPENDIDTLTQVIRGNGYRMFSRAASPAPAAISDPEKVFGDLRIRTLKVAAGSKADRKNPAGSRCMEHVRRRDPCDPARHVCHYRPCPGSAASARGFPYPVRRGRKHTKIPAPVRGRFERPAQRSPPCLCGITAPGRDAVRNPSRNV